MACNNSLKCYWVTYCYSVAFYMCTVKFNFFGFYRMNCRPPSPLDELLLISVLLARYYAFCVFSRPLLVQIQTPGLLSFDSTGLLSFDFAFSWTIAFMRFSAFPLLLLLLLFSCRVQVIPYFCSILRIYYHEK